MLVSRSWADIDARYAISFAYKGNFARKVLDAAGAQVLTTLTRHVQCTD